ncbi:MAG: hypothetical protein AAFO06_04525 [Cyanobacteria bacterium J06597_16]
MNPFTRYKRLVSYLSVFFKRFFMQLKSELSSDRLEFEFFIKRNMVYAVGVFVTIFTMTLLLSHLSTGPNESSPNTVVRNLSTSIVFSYVANLMFDLVYKALANKGGKVKKKKKQYKRLSVVGVYRNSLDNYIYISNLSLLSTISAYVFACQFSPVDLRLSVLYILCSIFILFNLYGIVTKYRIIKGLFLSNEFEARELLKFIKDHSSDIDFTDGSGKSKPIIKQSDLEDIAIQVAREAQGLA